MRCLDEACTQIGIDCLFLHCGLSYQVALSDKREGFKHFNCLCLMSFRIYDAVLAAVFPDVYCQCPGVDSLNEHGAV